MSVADNFDYSMPTIKKGNTMYLSVINNNDAEIRPFKKLVTHRDWSANLYNLDIESSMPRRFGVFTDKVDFINKVDDIERTNPKILHYPLNKPEYNLTNKDIPYSSPQINNLKTKRCTNPLEPKYQLPQVESYPPSEQKFIRDSIAIGDIEGTRPSKCFKWKTRETFPLDNFGVIGSKPKQKYVRKNLGKEKYDYIDYSDLTRDIFKTKRFTNPLDPLYEFKSPNKNDDFCKYGFIERSKPGTYYPYFYKPALNLKVNDIEGSNVGSKNFIAKYNSKNFGLTTQDIQGCNVGSLKKGIITKRCTNPLNPCYQYIGEKELEGVKNGEYSKKRKSNSMINNTRNRSGIINMKSNTATNKNVNLDNENNAISNINKMKIYDNQDLNPLSERISKEEAKNNNPSSTKIINSNNANNLNNNKAQNEEVRRTPLSAHSGISEHSRKSGSKANNNIEPKMLGINDLPEENNINTVNYSNYNQLYNEEQKTEISKPEPFYGVLHDPTIQSSDNKERLSKIEKDKKLKVTMSKTAASGFFNQKINKPNEMSNFQQNPNMAKFEQSKSGAAAVASVSKINFEEASSSGRRENNKSNNLCMNKTSNNFGPKKWTYEEKLDYFMAKNATIGKVGGNKEEKKGMTRQREKQECQGNENLGSGVNGKTNSKELVKEK